MTRPPRGPTPSPSRWKLLRRLRASCLILSLLVAAPTARAADQPPAGGASHFSLGLTLGQPLALSGRMYRGDRPFWDLNVGFAFGPGSRLWGDLLFPLKGIPLSGGGGSLQLYAGLGALLGLTTKPCGLAWGFNGCATDPYVGGRGAVGVEAVFRRSNFVVGLELGPGFGVGQDKWGPILDLFLSARLLL